MLVPQPGRAAEPAPPAADVPRVTQTGDMLVLSNSVVERHLRLPTAANPSLATTDFRSRQAPSRYFTGYDGKFRGVADEFGFLANDAAHDGRGGWHLVSVTDAQDAFEGRGVDLVLRALDGTIEVVVRYLLYSRLPLVRKRLTIRNLTTQPMKIENVDIERFRFEDYWPGTFSWVYSDYGRRKSLIPFAGGRQDALVALHNPDWDEGIVIGNEAAGVNKYTAAFVGGATFTSGLARKDGDFPHRRWLAPGEAFVTPQTFAIVYAGEPRFETILNTVVPDFVRRHMGIRLSQVPKPILVYNSWEPFQQKIDEKLIRELAVAAADAGVRELVIDDGWQDSYGDWGVDKAKFPNGLRPVMDHIKSLGMKPGLWLSIGSADPASAVFKAHPEWFAQDPQGQPYSMMYDADTNKKSACFSTGWREHILDKLLSLTAEHGLEYLKLDFAIVSSPYRYDTARTGCYAKDHPRHRDHAESLSVSFDAMWHVFDQFHARYPQVFIDCTFEAMGGLQLVDYAMLQHAEGNWLSNYNEGGSTNDLRVRNMAWWRSPAMPATALVIGNSKLSDDGFDLHLKSLAGALPIVLGDPRAMSPDARRRCRQFADWLAAMSERHDIFSYRQDLAGFGEPQDGAWDGFQRINTETRSGGIAGVFRHGDADPTRRVTIGYLDRDALYDVRTLEGRPVARATGRALGERGFDCTLDKPYDGQVFQIDRVSTLQGR